MTTYLPGPAAARAPERPVVLLSCPDPAPGGGPLCQALIQALAETAGSAGPVIRPVARGAETPQRPGDTGVALHLAAAGEHRLAGHLDWRQGAAPRRRGPEVRLDVMDGTISPELRAGFARDLIRATPGLTDALRGPARP